MSASDWPDGVVVDWPIPACHECASLRHIYLSQGGLLVDLDLDVDDEGALLEAERRLTGVVAGIDLVHCLRYARQLFDRVKRQKQDIYRMYVEESRAEAELRKKKRRRAPKSRPTKKGSQRRRACK